MKKLFKENKEAYQLQVGMVKGCSEEIEFNQEVQEEDYVIGEMSPELEQMNFGLDIKNMRELTAEENKAISDYVESISKPLGINIFDDKTIIERLDEYSQYLDKEISKYSKTCQTIFSETVTSPNICCVLQEVRKAILNIIEGRDFDDFGNNV